MNYKITFLVALFISQLSFSQIVINELDCDSPGAETHEFLELLSETPNYPLDGFVVDLTQFDITRENLSRFIDHIKGHTEIELSKDEQVILQELMIIKKFYCTN